MEMLFAGQGVWYRFQSSPRPVITEKRDISVSANKRSYEMSYLCKYTNCRVLQGVV